MKHKTSILDLAILRGPALFDDLRCVGRPNVGDRGRLHDRIEDILNRRWFTNDGAYLKEFESRLCEMPGVSNAVAVSNATIGLQILIRALELTGEVILPAFTFVATAHAVEWERLTPVFADIDPVTHNLDPEQVERLITPRTSAILGVHVWGRPCAIDELTEIARRHGVRLIFDAAHALGCTHHGQPIGSFGEAEVLSFHATKVVNSLEGGAILTANRALATRLRKMRNFGFDGVDNVVCLGTNGKMNEFEAAVGLGSLERFAEFVEVNRRNLQAYRNGLSDIPGLQLIQYDKREFNNFQYVVAEVDDRVCPLSRDQLVAVLERENVVARRYFYPGCHRMEPYRSRYPSYLTALPNTDRVASSVLTLPTGTGITESEIEQLCRVLSLAIENADIIQTRLNPRLARKAA